MTSIRSRTAQVNGVQLDLLESGPDDGPVIILSHGFPESSWSWRHQLPVLGAAGWHAIAPDQRGHGESHKPDDETAYSFDLYAADLLGLLDALGWSSAVALGHSMGGMVLQTAAVSAPERFEAIVLMDTSHRALKADGNLIDLAIGIARAEGMAAVMAAQDAMADEDSPLGTEASRRLEAERPGYKEFGQRKMLASSPAMYAAMIRVITDATSGLDRLDDLRALTMPALVIVGDGDRPFLKPSARMAEAIPGATLAVIPDAGHSPQFEATEHWWKALTAFLEQV